MPALPFSSLCATAPGWESLRSFPELPADEIHLWLVDLALPRQQWHSFLSLIDEQERQRAARFTDERDQARFIIAHAALRAILARYLSVLPQAVRFSGGNGVKPTFAADMNTNLCFNLSHSHDLAICAVARQRDVGVDIEYICNDFPYEMVTAHFLTSQEQIMLSGLPARQRRTGFYHCWTRKEALVKALGAGLSLPLDSFAVTLAPGSAAEFLPLSDTTYLNKHWSLRDINLSGVYAGALAAAGHGWQSRQLRWSWREAL